MEKTTFLALNTALNSALTTMTILSGDIIGAGESWQDEARCAANQFRYLADLLDNAANDNAESFLVFPSPLVRIPRNSSAIGVN